MKLELLFDQLLTRATRFGTDQAANLPGGARLAVRVRDGATIVTVSRDGKTVGDVEIVTFRRVCRVPETAERIPREGQGTRGSWRYVAWRWTETTGQEELPL